MVETVVCKMMNVYLNSLKTNRRYRLFEDI
jgi:hypothetical protein